ncbi:MAG TPA: hypothetical protein VNQ76_06760 [Planctomicrobium sp.]|nr:hypothetical protein [Planctomicrobium sp.]
MFSNRFWVFHGFIKRTPNRIEPRWESADQFGTLLAATVYTEFVHLGLHGRTPAV